MKIVAQLAGGLGNQLFIYAMGRATSIRNAIPLSLDARSGYKNDHFERSFLLDKFNICADLATRSESSDFPGGSILRSLSFRVNSLLPYERRWILNENSHKFESEFLAVLRKSVYLSGYWQSYRYFQDVAPQIKKDLTLKSLLDGENRDIELEIVNSESVSIHVRQDNLSHSLNLDYYFRAVEILKSKVKNPKYFVFSDSPKMSVELSAALQARLVDVNNQDECYKDLALMSRCRHHIAANSTFSWWGAWLADSKGKQVVVPESIRKFNADIIPPEWIVLDY